MLKERIKKLRKIFQQSGLDLFLTDDFANRYYLSGLESSAGWLLISLNSAYLLVDSRYFEKAKKEVSDFFEVIEVEDFFKATARICETQKIKRVGFESHNLTHQKLVRLKSALRGKKLVGTIGLVEDLRSQKDESEVTLILRSIRVAEIAFKNILNLIKPGVSEAELAWELEKKMRDLGAEKVAWQPLLIAVGENSALPHYGHGKHKIKNGDIVQFDFGAVVGGYYSDISRVVFVGKPSVRQKQIYNLVLEAQRQAIDLVKDGAVGGRIDGKVKEFLRKKTDGVFRHSLGHGVGLEIHELPRLYVGSKEKLQSGNVITIEPGIYLPGWGGVRIEDMVLITKDGCKVLTKLPKKIEEVTV
ncbi:MAG: hypothetical protein A2Y57_04370 [Candidatus Woykebacteria bacterium RBG_13_40_7b]|uniref:Xaa-Pro dipeptidase n=1 Tax=Candidatus Woykebacteria bacterium RBG_13_40_7b TaxID=1802594 RepID=A0A1G1W8D9_9BACT|nr:MAG: hypothetical protein A2Y57_04370 [Candidatus Woykebacteria bacterium RBG_13_40_7b]